MWINRKEYEFLKKNAEKNINAEVLILRAVENQKGAVARAMEEYSAALKEVDRLKNIVSALENELDQIRKVVCDESEIRIGYWEQGDYYDMGDTCSLCGYDSSMEPCDLIVCPSCHAIMKQT